METSNASRLAECNAANRVGIAAVSETVAIAIGAVVAAYLGVGWLRRLSAYALSRIIFVLLVILGLSMMVEAFFEIAPVGLLPLGTAARIIAGLLFGFLIGAISSVLGVAGGEVIIGLTPRSARNALFSLPKFYDYLKLWIALRHAGFWGAL